MSKNDWIQKVHRPGSRSTAAIHRLVWCGAGQPRQPGRRVVAGHRGKQSAARCRTPGLFPGGTFAVVERAIHAGAAQRRPDGDRP